MVLKLSIERFSEGKLHGSTSNIGMIIKNGELAKDLISEDPKYTNLFFKAGRFVAATLVQNNQAELYFFDLKKDRQAAIGLAKKYYKEDKGQYDLFMYIFNQVTENYEKDYNEVELELDESFGQTFIMPN